MYSTGSDRVDSDTLKMEILKHRLALDIGKHSVQQ